MGTKHKQLRLKLLPEEKRCQRCRRMKLRNTDNFYANRGNASDGLANICKDCNAEEVMEGNLRRLYKRSGFEGVMALAEQHIERGQKILSFLHKLQEPGAKK